MLREKMCDLGPKPHHARARLVAVGDKFLERGPEASFSMGENPCLDALQPTNS
jgi:hypothetical protein